MILISGIDTRFFWIVKNDISNLYFNIDLSKYVNEGNISNSIYKYTVFNFNKIRV